MKDKGFKWMKTHVVFAAVFILLLFIDRFTKSLAITHLMKGDYVIIDGVLRLHYLENRGAAWGLFENAFWLFYIATAVSILIMAYLYSRLPFERKYLLLRALLVILCAGAVGNFIDRALNHYVVDFIYLELINFPVFNVADCYVTISVLMLVISLIFIYGDDNDLFRKRDR